MNTRALALFAALLTLSAGCRPPKYTTYRSVSGDFTAAVPWGWDVVADAQDKAFSQVVFLGPFDKDFYLGVPSLSVRWYASFQGHRLRDGRVEMYSNSDDFVRQILKDVYGSGSAVYGKLADADRPVDARAEIEPAQVSEIVLKGSGLKAKYFAVLSPTPTGEYSVIGTTVNKNGSLPVFSPIPAVQKITIGTVVDLDGRRINQRYHEYAVVPILVDGREQGFYVICYPATLIGHNKGLDRFRALIGTFHPYTAGPGGTKITVPGPRGEEP